MDKISTSLYWEEILLLYQSCYANGILLFMSRSSHNLDGDKYSLVTVKLKRNYQIYMTRLAVF